MPELTPTSISIVDQHGNLLSGTNDRSLDASQLKFVQQVEQNYVKRVEAILAPIVGKDNVHAQVTADVDFSSVEHTDESYKPNQDPTRAVIRSQQTSESSHAGRLRRGRRAGRAVEPAAGRRRPR